MPRKVGPGDPWYSFQPGIPWFCESEALSLVFQSCGLIFQKENWLPCCCWEGWALYPSPSLLFHTFDWLKFPILFFHSYLVMFCSSTHTTMPFCSKWQVLLCSGCFKSPSEPNKSVWCKAQPREKSSCSQTSTSPSTHPFPCRQWHSFYLSRGMKFSWDVEVWLYIIAEVSWQGWGDKLLQRTV